jgi:hypothetical protein
MYTRFPLESFDVVYAWYPSVLEGKVFYMLLLFCFVRFLDCLIRAPLHKSCREPPYIVPNLSGESVYSTGDNSFPFFSDRDWSFWPGRHWKLPTEYGQRYNE